MLGGLYPQGLPLLSALSLGDALSADRQIISNYCIPHTCNKTECVANRFLEHRGQGIVHLPQN